MGDVHKNAGYAAARAVTVADVGPAIETRIKGFAGAHRKTGAYIRSVKVRSQRVLGVAHTVVVVEDPQAENIEKGTKRKRADGSIVRIPGQRILLKTTASFPGGG
jgi:hypothetical protein